jgi:endonuclease/exonuclease/phosphatase family metal-dependent hydrolase
MYDSCPRNDIKIILGDMNAKTSKEDKYYPTIGKHSLHDNSNDNGQRLINFSASRGMVIGSTLFPHKEVHKGTWKAPDRQTINQIDHILIDVRHKSNLMDLRSLRGANIASDHFLVLSKLRARITSCKNECGIKMKK